jgi:6-pyruvoyltetrahydropterin/6-carboxytetrahydropterin synthase
MIHITRRERFSAAHMLSRPDWSNEKNSEVFGKCSNPNWHGHNYELFVTIKGEINPETGFVANLSQVGKIIKEKVIKWVDHKNLNLDVPFMNGMYTSTENLAVAIWEQIESEIHKLGCELHCVKLQETENNFVEYYGK